CPRICACSTNWMALACATFSSPKECQVLPAPAASAGRDDRLSPTSCSTAGCSRTSGTRYSTTSRDDTTSGPS
ncbi:hypothetical protein PtrEW4_010466, partial [Pyrenophora tritici-repentis]